MAERSAAAPASEARSRHAGVLLHPSSLPGPYGIGDLGGKAYQWVDALAHAQQKFWQILPLNPTGFGEERRHSCTQDSAPTKDRPTS